LPHTLITLAARQDCTGTGPEMFEGMGE
jgi:hypothetical protein